MLNIEAAFLAQIFVYTVLHGIAFYWTKCLREHSGKRSVMPSDPEYLKLSKLRSA